MYRCPFPFGRERKRRRKEVPNSFIIKHGNWVTLVTLVAWWGESSTETEKVRSRFPEKMIGWFVPSTWLRITRQVCNKPSLHCTRHFFSNWQQWSHNLRLLQTCREIRIQRLVGMGFVVLVWYIWYTESLYRDRTMYVTVQCLASCEMKLQKQEMWPLYPYSLTLL